MRCEKTEIIKITNIMDTSKEFLINLGVLLIVVGAVLLALGAFVFKDMVDYNWYTCGSFILMIIGLVAHILINKYKTE